MLPYATVEAAETALGRSLTAAETLWLNYSGDKSDYLLYCHNLIFLFPIFSLLPFYYLSLEFFFEKSVRPYKIQPKVKLSLSDTIRCYKSVMHMFFLVLVPLQLVSCPSNKMIGIRTSLPLPSLWEIMIQLGLYFIVEDYTNYWIYRFLHCKWGYDKIHKVHHEYTAPIGFVSPYAHWAEILIIGFLSFLGPAMVPGHVITYWLWIALKQIEAIETHSGPTKYIPFYIGPDYHDYHHYVGEQIHSNFASVFTYCDYIYGTDKGYRYQKKVLQQLRDGVIKSNGEEIVIFDDMPSQGQKE